MARIKIVIDDATGEITVDGEDFKGTSCDAAMGEFERALGKIERRQDKPEYRREAQRTQENRR